LPDNVLDHNQEDPHALAMTGPKDVIVMIDCSSTMSHEHNIYHAKKAAKKAIKALTYADYAQVIKYDTSAESGQGAKLLPMTDANKDLMYTFIEGMSAAASDPNTKSRLDDALALAFTIIEASITAGDNTTCFGRGAILVVSDFHDPDYSQANLNGYNRWRRFMVFQYNLTIVPAVSGAACDSDGAAWQI